MKIYIKLLLLLNCLYFSNCFTPNIINSKMKLNLNFNINPNKDKIKNTNFLTKKKLKYYYILSRPSSIIYEFALPLTGYYLVNRNINFIAEPTLLLVAILSVLIGRNSMIINDYFDYKSGADKNKKGKILNKGFLKSEDVLNFSNLLNMLNFYLIALIDSNIIRLLLGNAIVKLYLYTPLLKPLPFIKNFICALTISQSLIIGGLINYTSNLANLLPATIYLFTMILWQELVLDILDIKYDKENNINTIPVKYGYNNSNKLALSYLLIATFTPLGLSNFLFILLQFPLISLNIKSIQNNKKLNKNVLSLSKFIMLLSGIFFCLI